MLNLDDTDGDDEVLAVIPVYNANSLSGSLHVFQCPARSASNPYQHDVVNIYFSRDPSVPGQRSTDSFSAGSAPHTGPVRGAELGKPQLITPHSRVTMECSLDTFHSPSFRPKQQSDDCMSDELVRSAEQKRHSIHGGGGEYEYTYTLQSRPFNARSNYLITCINGDGIHLSSVGTVQQFTPLLVSATTDAEGCDEEAFANATGERCTVGRGGGGMPRIPLTFCSIPGSSGVASGAAYERVRREMMRQRSSMLNALAEAAERLVYVKQGTPRSVQLRQQLLCTSREHLFALHGLTEPKKAQASRVANSLFPPEILISGAITGGEEAMQSTIMHSFASYFPVAEQVQQLMMRCQVLPFHVIREYIFVRPGQESDSSAPQLDNMIVGSLRFCAVYMHGVWVNRMDEQFKGAVAALREVILLEFVSHPRALLSRRQLYRFKLHTSFRQRALDIVRTLATLSGCAGERVWRLKYAYSNNPADRAEVDKFSHFFRSEVDTQNQAWQQRKQRVHTLLPFIASGRNPAQLLLVSRELQLSYQASANRHLEGEGASVLDRGGLLHSGAARSGHPALSSSSTAASSHGERDANPDLASIRQHIRSLFLDYGVLNKQRAKELVLQGRERHYPAATNAMLSAALQESVRVFTPSTWILKHINDVSIDRFRPVIVAAALELSDFTMKMLAANVTSKLYDVQSPFYSPNVTAASGSGKSGRDGEGEGEARHGDDASEMGCPIPLITLQRVVGEIAEYKTGERLWHLKSGNVMQA